MLVLSRKIGESIHIGDDIVIVISQVSGRNVRLGIQAPRSVNIRREELRGKRDDQARMSREIISTASPGRAAPR